eukprot:1192414-Prorocentrum_minimum.AAC.4
MASRPEALVAGPQRIDLRSHERHIREVWEYSYTSLTLPGLAPTPGRISDLGFQVRPSEARMRGTVPGEVLGDRLPTGRRSPGGGSREGGRATSRNEVPRKFLDGQGL